MVKCYNDWGIMDMCVLVCGYAYWSCFVCIFFGSCFVFYNVISMVNPHTLTHVVCYMTSAYRVRIKTNLAPYTPSPSISTHTAPAHTPTRPIVIMQHPTTSTPSCFIHEGFPSSFIKGFPLLFHNVSRVSYKGFPSCFMQLFPQQQGVP